MSQNEIPKGERVAKVIARSGACSRRQAEAYILDHKVTVNGETITSPALNVLPSDTITLGGIPLPKPEKTRLWRYYKPNGLLCTSYDPEGRPTIFDQLAEEFPDHPHLMSIGRLDLNSEGLLLLTNNGELARYLELPATEWVRSYKVRIFGNPHAQEFETLSQGSTIDGIRYGPIKITIERQQGSNCWIMIHLKEGKNREIRKVMDYLGYSVNRLLRLSYGPFELDQLNPGDVVEIPPSDIPRII